MGWSVMQKDWEGSDGLVWSDYDCLYQYHVYWLAEPDQKQMQWACMGSNIVTYCIYN